MEMSVSLRDMAAKWRASEGDEPLDSRHEYNPLIDLLSAQGEQFQVGQVGQVGHPSENSDLSLTYQGCEGRSGRSPLTSSGELTSWLAEGQQQPSTTPSAWGFTEAERDAALQRLRPEGSEHIRKPSVRAQDQPLPNLPGVPAEWVAGVYRLRTMRPPRDVDERRWDRFRYDALRLLHEHGALLHAARWDEVDVFGLHRLAPDRRTDGMGLAWLARKMVVVKVDAEAVTVRGEGGVEQRVYRRAGRAKVAVAAWTLELP